jgi:hypothetical protein
MKWEVDLPPETLTTPVVRDGLVAALESEIRGSGDTLRADSLSNTQSPPAHAFSEERSPAAHMFGDTGS